MNKKGQSIVEYALIAILVILGIAFMGGYVLRSINAHFKLWDDGVQDSMQENIRQAPANALPNITVNCSCNSQSVSCGGPGLLCAYNQREVDWNCSPLGCNGAAGNATCVEDDTYCCSGWVNAGCGTFPCPAGGCSAATPTSPDGNNCYYGYEIQRRQCGASASVQCVANQYSTSNPQGCPLPQCQGFSLFNNSWTYCSNAQTGLTKDTSISYVANQASCNGTPCQVYCNYPYVLNSPANNACVLEFSVADVSCSSPLNDPNTTVTNGGDLGATTDLNSLSSNTCGPTSAFPCCSSGGITNTSGSSYGSSNYVINNQSFKFCLNPGTGLATFTVIPYGTTAPSLTGIQDNNDACGNPGEPTQTCAINIKY